MGAQCAFIERKGQRAASLYHRYYTFTLATVHCCRLELAFPPCTAVHTTCWCFRSKYSYEKMLRWRKTLVVEQYLSNTFPDNECRPKIYPLRKKANYGITVIVYTISVVWHTVHMYSHKCSMAYCTYVLP